MTAPTMINYTTKFDTMEDKGNFPEGHRVDRVWISSNKVWAIFDMTHISGDRVLHVMKHNREYFNIHPNIHTGSMFFLNDDKRAKFHALPDYVARTFIDISGLPQRTY